MTGRRRLLQRLDLIDDRLRGFRDLLDRQDRALRRLSLMVACGRDPRRLRTLGYVLVTTDPPCLRSNLIDLDVALAHKATGYYIVEITVPDGDTP